MKNYIHSSHAYKALFFCLFIVIGGCQTPKQKNYEIKVSKEQKENLRNKIFLREYADINGNTIKVGELKAQIIIVNFWASWCGPCRFSNKQLVKLYSKYKDQGFEILSVSLDEEIKDWKKAVAKDKITWMQGIDRGGWDALAAIKWQVDALPSSFVVNKDGDVVAINLEKGDLEKKIKELLGL